MKEIDVTRLSDYVLSEAYFDLLSDRKADEDVLESVKVELEERDLLFEGYLIHDWTPGYRVRGCSYSFKHLTDLKDYISNHRGIEPTVDGSMHYCGYNSGELRLKNVYTSEELALKPEDCRLSKETEAKLTEIVNSW